jgi:hypothetical protein
MRLSETLFSPRLDLRWCFKGHHIELVFEGECIWHSNLDADGNPHATWDWQDNSIIAEALYRYASTPLEKLKRREVDFRRRLWAVSEDLALWNLFAILLAADRRIGKNIQSIWLFIGPTGVARKISQRRL